MTDDTRFRLLEAAERILIEEGAHALTVRHIGAVSGVNGTLITYHFGTVAGLLAELCQINLKPMVAEWQAADVLQQPGGTLREILSAWLEPLIRPAAFTKGGRSLVLFDEIASHGEHSVRDELLHTMTTMGRRIVAALKPHVPHLSARELRVRVRFIAAAALGPPPRVQLKRASGQEPLDGFVYLVAFAESALLGPPVTLRARRAQREELSENA